MSGLFVAERLETRCLLTGVTAGFDSVAGLLTVTGTSVADQITIRRVATTSGAKIDVLAGTTSQLIKSVSANLLKRITVNAGGGDDKVTVAGTPGQTVAQPMTVNGGPGNDRLMSGDGNDTLNGGDGNDVLVSSRGADVFSGGAGIDEVTYASETAVNVSADGIANDGRTSGVGTTTSTRERDNVLADVENLRGGAGNDVLKATANTAATLWGGGGNDTLLSGNASDSLFGDAGSDRLLGGAGNDKLFGGDGDDELNGAAGADQFNAGTGNDVLVALDNGFGDHLTGGIGNDIVWADRSSTGSDTFCDPSTFENSRTVRFVSSFANGADRTLDGDRFADPLSVGYYQSFAGKPLFAAGGPTIADVTQGDAANCWLMAPLAAIAQRSPLAVRAMVADFGDGTYGVALGGRYYRVDADLAVQYSGTPAYAALGNGGSLWAALVEKAYAIHRNVGTGDTRGDYAALNWGDPTELFQTLKAAGTGWGYHASNGGTSFASELYQRWAAGESITLSTGSTPPMGLTTLHTYTVASVTISSTGTVTGLRLRNPWGGADAMIDLTPQALAPYEFWTGFGNMNLA